jgi:predicted RNA-binding Zn-ribbon protein involved in translation (DUF1610 family)
MVTEEVAMNAARFSVNCPECGDVELAADQLWLVLPTAGDAHYDFYCPDCGELVREIAGPSAIAFLAPLVAVEEMDVPAEALEPRSGPSLTMDDVLDFANDLSREDWEAELLGDDAWAA